MGRSSIYLALLVSCLTAMQANAATGRVIKMLPFFVDLQQRHSLAPSLFERDAYQFQLRQHPEQQSGMLFDVHWKTKGTAWAPVKLRVELRGVLQGNRPTQSVLEKEVQPGGWFSRWTGLKLSGAEYKLLGEVTAWRATLWEGDQLLGEQKSFLW
jgi:hypothetical protein